MKKLLDTLYYFIKKFSEKEIIQLYKDLNIKRDDSTPVEMKKKENIGIYDMNKKSYLDNKTSSRTRYNYGWME